VASHCGHRRSTKRVLADNGLTTALHALNMYNGVMFTVKTPCFGV